MAQVFSDQIVIREIALLRCIVQDKHTRYLFDVLNDNLRWNNVGQLMIVVNHDSKLSIAEATHDRTRLVWGIFGVLTRKNREITIGKRKTFSKMQTEMWGFMVVRRCAMRSPLLPPTIVTSECFLSVERTVNDMTFSIALMGKQLRCMYICLDGEKDYCDRTKKVETIALELLKIDWCQTIPSWWMIVKWQSSQFANNESWSELLTIGTLTDYFIWLVWVSKSCSMIIMKARNNAFIHKIACISASDHLVAEDTHTVLWLLIWRRLCVFWEPIDSCYVFVKENWWFTYRLV
jgi:hypothetical protein